VDRAEAQAAVGREWAGRVAEEWVDRSFPMEGKGQAGRGRVGRDRVGRDKVEDRPRSRRDNAGGLRRIARACSLGRRDAGGTINPWSRA
jgi:hypothetical protein